MTIQERIAKSIRQGSAKAPDLKIPELRMPDVKLPEINLGQMKLPRLTFESAMASRQMKNRVSGRRRSPSLVSILGGAIGGALLFYFLDPQRGASRRAQVRDQVMAATRRLRGNMAQLGSRAGANANGFSQRMVHLRSGGTPVDDLTLRDRVESEIFRDHNLPKGRLNFDVESGVVTIRGQIENAYEIASIEKAVLKVRGVNGVENLMHLQGTPAPNKVEAREAIQ